ncbi:hypothetical protein BDV30DRAFT_238935 [Aspergillus minisclerotigenes]|uniref:Uncharacterized protein n=1 Tax=Aspergillus minisclerotigenes TaxID=656917 RepID=A0A5N6J5T2_9EURO|nr:hypothetical protein BDV30DRAFT_238935 [Aspergillus minisclerotigenes]
MSLYLTIVYIILFTCLEGHTLIFRESYSLSQGLRSITWCGIFVGMVLVWGIVLVIYPWTRKELEETSRIRPGTRPWYAMLGGAPAVAVGLFWMDGLLVTPSAYVLPRRISGVRLRSNNHLRQRVYVS